MNTTSTPYCTVLESKVAYAPLETGRFDKEGQEIMRFVRIGIRVEMADGSKWFKHDKSGSWTRHYAGIEDDAFTCRPVSVPRKDTFTPRQFQRAYGDRPEFLAALTDAVALAEELDAMKRLR